MTHKDATIFVLPRPRVQPWPLRQHDQTRVQLPRSWHCHKRIIVLVHPELRPRPL